MLFKKLRLLPRFSLIRTYSIVPRWCRISGSVELEEGNEEDRSDRSEQIEHKRILLQCSLFYNFVIEDYVHY